MHLAILEDDPIQREFLAAWCRSAGHEVTCWPSFSSVRTGLAHAHCDVLLLDWTLKDGIGLEVIEWLRLAKGWSCAIVVLTAHEDERLVVEALSAGADDFMIKPASKEVLLARIQAAYRRVSPQGLLVFRLGPYEVDVSRHQISIEGVPQAMTQKEFEMATYLLQNPGRLFSRDHLLNKVWGMEVLVESRTVDTHASRLRKKLRLDGSTGWRLTSVYGYGYRLTAADAEE